MANNFRGLIEIYEARTIVVSDTFTRKIYYQHKFYLVTSTSCIKYFATISKCLQDSFQMH